MNGILYQECRHPVGDQFHRHVNCPGRADGREASPKSCRGRDEPADGCHAKRQETLKLRFANENLTNEVAQYKSAVDTLTAKLKEAAYAGIERQNESITNPVAQRDEPVNKRDDTVKARK